MPENIRALIVVLVISVPTFLYIGRPLTALIVTPREFAVWRNAWCASTAAAFLTGHFFLFAIIVPLICLYALANRAATVALFFMLLFAVPVGSAPIQGFGIFQSLFELNNPRLLAIVLLLPILLATGSLGGQDRGASGTPDLLIVACVLLTIALGIVETLLDLNDPRPLMIVLLLAILLATASLSRRNGGAYSIPDLLVVGYVLLTIGLHFEENTGTQIMRFATLQTLDVLIPYFAFSRVVTNIADLNKVLVAFVIAALTLSLIAVLEFARHWHLYYSASKALGGNPVYLSRGGALRAEATAGGPIELGFTIMSALGLVLALRQTILSQRLERIALAILAAGLVATLSRGPWIGAAVLTLTYLATGPNPVANLGKAAYLGVVAVVALLLTPVGDRVLKFLPFIGSVDADTVTYRQNLFKNAVAVIERSPWLGNLDFLSTQEMRSMLQGKGIVDVVNTYLGVTLSYGLVGLVLFLGFFVAILIGLLRVLKFGAAQEIGISACGRAFLATLVAMLVTLATTSGVDFTPYVYWSIAGLSVALIRIAYSEYCVVAPE